MKGEYNYLISIGKFILKYKYKKACPTKFDIEYT